MRKSIKIGVLLLILLSAAIIVGCVSQLPRSGQPQNLGEQSEDKVSEFTTDDVIKMTWEYFYGSDRESMPKFLEGKVIRLRGRVDDISSNDPSLFWLGPFTEDWKEYSNYGTKPLIRVREPDNVLGEIKMNDTITLEGIFYPRTFIFEIK